MAKAPPFQFAKKGKAPPFASAKSGPTGKVGGFGMKRSKPDFAGGGPQTNVKSNKKKGEFPW